MAISYSTTLRNAMLAEIDTQVNSGTAGGFLRIYSGTKPAPGGTATTLLAELRFSDPAFGTPSNGVVSANAIADETATLATGTATWFRVTNSSGTYVLDGTVGVTGSGADLILNSTSISANQIVKVSSFTITEGNN